MRELPCKGQYYVLQLQALRKSYDSLLLAYNEQQYTIRQQDTCLRLKELELSELYNELSHARRNLHPGHLFAGEGQHE